LAEAQVVAVTCVGAGCPLVRGRFKLCVVDEASQVDSQQHDICWFHLICLKRSVSKSGTKAHVVFFRKLLTGQLQATAWTSPHVTIMTMHETCSSPLICHSCSSVFVLNVTHGVWVDSGACLAFLHRHLV